MRTATFLVLSALGMACAHQAAQPPAQRQAALTTAAPHETAPSAAPPPTELRTSSATSEASGDPNLGTLELVSHPATPRAELPHEVSGADKEGLPRPIEPEAPTVVALPPGSATPTPPREVASKSELELRERIQRTLLREPSLSFTAKRVRVEVEHDRVTLLGEVRTAREKSEVEDLVQKVSGVRRVKNQLAVIDQTARNPGL